MPKNYFAKYVKGYIINLYNQLAVKVEEKGKKMKRLVSVFVFLIIFLASTFQVFATEVSDDDVSMSRYDFVKLINDSFKFTESSENTFADIEKGSMFEKEFSIACKAEYIIGDSNQNARPKDKITRTEVAVILARVCSLSTYTFDIQLSKNENISWAAENIKSAVKSEFFTLENEMFRPNDFVSRNEALRIIEKINTEKYNNTKIDSVLEIPSFDDYVLKGRLSVPEEGEIDKLIIYVNGSGPNSYLNKRQVGNLTFNYFDLFANEFTKDNTAFFSYNTRGVDIGTEAPTFDSIDEKEYKNYLPSVQIKDIKAMINYLKSLNNLKNSKIYLLGWSEGTNIAPLVASEKDIQVDGLLLAGYYNNGLEDILKWQLSGGSSMVFYLQYFDLDCKGYVTKEDYEKDPNGLVNTTLNGTKFEEIDLNKNERIDEADFNIMLEDRRKQIFEAIKNDDDAWLKENYAVRLTSAWFKEHFNLKPNNEILPSLDIPIYIFQGVQDANTPVSDTYEIKKTFEELGKTNLHTYIFENHDHDLNYIIYPFYNEIPEGIKKIFSVSKEL